MAGRGSLDDVARLFERMERVTNDWREGKLADDSYWANVERAILNLARMADAQDLLRLTREPRC